MSSRSDEYRHRAAEAKNRAAQTSSPSIKSASKKWRAAGCYLPSKRSGWTCRGLPDATRTRALSANARPRGDARGRDGRIREELAAGIKESPAGGVGGFCRKDEDVLGGLSL